MILFFLTYLFSRYLTGVGKSMNLASHIADMLKSIGIKAVVKKLKIKILQTFFKFHYKVV